MTSVATSPARRAVLSAAGVAYVACETAVSYRARALPPFKLEFEHQDDQWTVADRDTGVFGSGTTLFAAVQDFSEAVREHVDVLERQEELSDALAEQLRYLHTRLRRT